MKRLISGVSTQRRATARPTPLSQCESLASWQDRKRLAYRPAARRLADDEPDWRAAWAAGFRILN
jgi:hypothetical protein